MKDEGFEVRPPPNNIIELVRDAVLKETEMESIWLKYPKIIRYFTFNHNEDGFETIELLDSLTTEEKKDLRCKIQVDHKKRTVKYIFVNAICKSEHLPYYNGDTNAIKWHEYSYDAHMGFLYHVFI